MAFMGLALVGILLALILASTFLAFVLFVVSLTLFLLYKKTPTKGKKLGAIITLAVGIVLLLPILFILLVSSL